jgi:hypothetical protein
MVMILGNLLIAIAPKDMFYYGIAFSIIGTGFLNLMFLLWLANYTTKTIPEEMQVTECSMQELILVDF